MIDELILSPFERTHVGSHGAFVFRVNREHESEAVKRIRERNLAEVKLSFGDKPRLVPKRKQVLADIRAKDAA